MKKVTGIGGIFFKTKDPGKTRLWYSTHLGLSTDEYGATFEWRQADRPERKGYTQWSVMSEDSDYFQPSGKDFMINFRVENIIGLVEMLKSEGVTVLDEIAEFEYGKFVHILDPDGIKIELWEPADSE